MIEENIMDINRSLSIAKQRLNYELLKSAITKIDIQEENRRTRLKIAFLISEKDDFFQSQLKYKQITEDLMENLKILQNDYFITKQKNEELNSELQNLEKKLHDFEEDTSKINSIKSQNATLLQKISILETELINEKKKVQNLQEKVTNQTTETINKMSDSSDIYIFKKDNPKPTKPKISKKSNKSSKDNNQNKNKYIINNDSKTSQEKKDISNKIQQSNDKYTHNHANSPTTTLQTKRDDFKSNSTFSAFSVTPFLDRTNGNTRNLLLSPLHSNKSLKTNSTLKKDILKIENQNITKKKRKLGAIGKTLFDETPKGLINTGFLQNVSPLKRGRKTMTIQPFTNIAKQ
ncbi:hypothetical protein PCANB_002960 [Pneumocystis canis]|nr:hypothetical protein PCANB_002960 [Pneumocystis canis]